MGTREREPSGDDVLVDAAPRPQHLIVTVFGRYGRSRDGLLRVADLITLLGALGVDAGAVRSSVSRLKQRGILVSDRGGPAPAYRLSRSLETAFEAGDHRIFEARRAAVDDDWLLASFSVPERERPLRHRVRTLLRRHGFGHVSGGLWIATGIILDEVRAALDHAELSDYVDLFLGEPVDQLPDAIQRWWDLDELEPLYQSFLDTFAPLLDDRLGEKESFAAYVSAVTQWRHLVYLDPGIPLELLPSGWSGVEAEHLFSRLHRALSGPAERFVAGIVD